MPTSSRARGVQMDWKVHALPETAFIITIDTEGDDLWARPREITTRNAAYLPRFQSLCERFRFKPVYLTNYEMAMSDFFVEFARDVVARGAGEIGMHLHAWNSPPLHPLTSDDFHFQPYLIEYPDEVMKEKIRTLTQLLEDRFDQKMVSHRAGRCGFDARYAAMLIEEGYRVDCSVTPGIDWSGVPGDPRGNGGSDYTAFPSGAYFVNLSDISVSGASALLEVPMTVEPNSLYRKLPCVYRIRLVRRAANRVSPGLSWLGPIQPTLATSLHRNLEVMSLAAQRAKKQGAQHVEFMMHSSELMPGGSPTFKDASDIERVYEHLEMLFEDLSTWCCGVTLREFHAQFGKSPAEASTSGITRA
jgi:hypothetical protein